MKILKFIPILFLACSDPPKVVPITEAPDYRDFRPVCASMCSKAQLKYYGITLPTSESNSVPPQCICLDSNR